MPETKLTKYKQEMQGRVRLPKLESTLAMSLEHAQCYTREDRRIVVKTREKSQRTIHTATAAINQVI